VTPHRDIRTMTEEPPGGFLTLSDLEEAASKNVLEPAWAYVRGGAGEELTMRANREAFQRRTLRPRVLVNVENLDLTATLLKEKVSAPFYISPTAYQGLLHPDAELATARAASSANILAIFSTISSRSLEEIAQAAPTGPRWFQLYLQPENATTQRLVERAEKAGYTALVLTVDAPVFGNRDKTILGGFNVNSVPLGNGRDVFPPTHPTLQGQLYHTRSEASATWDTLDQLRKLTHLPFLVKGILTREDAQLALDHGARGIIVSNHGGRQLDQVQASLDALPEIVETVGGKAEVYLDGGVRRGSDILIALATGAKAVGLGRPVLWALAAGGETGVARFLTLLKEDLATTMALAGRRTIAEVDRTLLGPPRQ
jgi:isopentenyl diphosphate isomerase/L-lactate dehydrogenase-like FMN-dependent dehydrogenase